jgi:hypothetical protein
MSQEINYSLIPDASFKTPAPTEHEKDGRVGENKNDERIPRPGSAPPYLEDSHAVSSPIPIRGGGEIKNNPLSAPLLGRPSQNAKEPSSGGATGPETPDKKEDCCFGPPSCAML